jgi:hypothetical protein
VGVRRGLLDAADDSGTRKRVRFMHVKEDADSGWQESFGTEAGAVYALWSMTKAF